MSEYTDQDRERSQKTYTLVEESIKQNDERHSDIKDILKIHAEKIEDNTEKIQGNKNMLIRVTAIGGIITIPVIAALTAFGKKLIG